MRRRLLFVGIIAAAARAQDVHNATALAAGIADGATLYVAEATLVLADEVAVADGVDCAIRRRGGLASATLDGADATRLFAVDGWLTLDSLTLTRGAAPSSGSCGMDSTSCNGGAVWVGASGRLTLVGVTLVANEGAYRGGAVFVSGGRVIASRSTFDDNFAMHSVRARETSRGVHRESSPIHERLASPSAFLSGSLALSQGGAIYFDDGRGDFAFGCAFSDNSAMNGGALFVRAPRREPRAQGSGHEAEAHLSPPPLLALSR